MQISHSSRQGRWAWWRKRIRYYVPVFQWLPNYDLRHDAPADVMAGLAVACLLVPQALSYAALAKLQPMYGLYSSTMGLVVYAILGTSRYLCVGPEAVVSLMTGSSLAVLAPLATPILGTGGGAVNGSVSLLSLMSAPDQRTTPLLTYGPPTALPNIAVCLSLAVGIVTFALGLFRFGFLDAVISRSLLSGFVAAISVTIIIEQLASLLGIPDVHAPVRAGSLLPAHGDETARWPGQSSMIDHAANATMPTPAGPTIPLEPEKSPIEVLMDLLYRLDHVHMYSVLFGLGALALLVALAWVKGRLQRYMDQRQTIHEATTTAQPSSCLSRTVVSFFLRLPNTIVVVALSTAICYVGQFHERYGVAVLADKLVLPDTEQASISASTMEGFLAPALPTIFTKRYPMVFYQKLFTAALTIILTGFVESLAAAKKYASLIPSNPDTLSMQSSGPVLSPNRELVALGAVNIVSSCFHAYPVFASFPRTTLAVRSGARTAFSSLVTVVAVALVTQYALPAFNYLPQPVMAAVIIDAASHLIPGPLADGSFRVRCRAYLEVLLMVISFTTTLAISMEAGVVGTFALSLLMVVRDSTYPRLSVIGYIPRSYDHATADTLPPSPPTFRPLTKEFPTAVPLPGFLIVQIDEPLHFANANRLKDRLRRLERYGNLLTHPSEDPSAWMTGQPHHPTPMLGESDMDADQYLSGEDDSDMDALMVDDDDESPNAAMVDESVNIPSPVTASTPLLRRRGNNPLKHVIFDIGYMPLLDVSAIQTFMEIVKDYLQRHITVSFVNLRGNTKIKRMFLRSGILNEIGGVHHVFGTLDDAIRYRISSSDNMSTETIHADYPTRGPGQRRNSIHDHPGFSTYDLTR